MKKRQFLYTLGAAGASSIGLSPAWANANTYPEKAVKIVVGVAAGGGVDMAARALADHMTKVMGQPFVVENRPGAGGNIATVAVAQAPADGYTLLLAGTGINANLALFRNPGYDLARDFAGVAMTQREPALLVVAGDSPITNINEFVTAMRAKSAGVTFGSGGFGQPAHVSGNAIAKELRLGNPVHVPYRGAGELVTAIIGKQVDYGVPTIAIALPQVRSGRLRALAVTSNTRSPVLPNIPTLNETVIPGFHLVGPVSILAPARTPKDVIAKLHREITKYASTPEFSKARQETGAEAYVHKTPQAVLDELEREIPKWRKLVSDSGAKLD